MTLIDVDRAELVVVLHDRQGDVGIVRASTASLPGRDRRRAGTSRASSAGVARRRRRGAARRRRAMRGLSTTG